MDNLFSLLSYFAVLSVATERLTEIVKNTLLTKFADKINAAVYQGIAAVFGGMLAHMAPPDLGNMSLPHWGVVLITGLAVSGGSGFWNSVLSTMNEFKKNMAQAGLKKE